MPQRDLISRGSKKPSPFGSSLFVALRSLDPFLQYGILAFGVGSSLLHKVGLNTLPPGLPLRTGIQLIDALGLSSDRLVLLAMSVGSSLKQIYWLLALSQEELKPSAAIGVSVFNTIINSISTLAFTTRLFSASNQGIAAFPQAPLVIGSALYIAGILTETIAERQRAQFKADPKNRGKCYTGGLWQFARHINYGGYVLWRVGFALAGGGWGWGLFYGLFFFSDFTGRAIPVLDEYCTKRYGEQWSGFKKQTPYKILPYIY